MRTTTKLGLLTLAVLAVSAAAGAPTASAAACDEIVANGNGVRQPNAAHTYFVNPATFEPDDRIEHATLSITSASHTWNAEVTDCWHLAQNPDRVEHITEFGGYTALRANARNMDGQHTVDFGTFGGQPEWGVCSQGGALACAVWYTNPLNRVQILDADIRFDVWWDWYDGRNGGDAWRATVPSNQCDIWSVAAHEFGHTLGFGHASGPNQTMYGSYSCGNNIGSRTLGAADMYGYRSYYANIQDP